MPRGERLKAVKREEPRKTVKLTFVSPMYDEWTFEVDGEEFSIVKGGTEVPEDKEEQIKEAASKHSIALVRV